jgi:hypothetical protein
MKDGRPKMKLTAFVLAALTALGALTTAATACERHEAAACGMGQAYDAATHSCLPKTGS